MTDQYNLKNFTELDFDKIKDSLKDYIKNHPSKEFTDHNFEGSNLSFLMDVLSYNAQMQAFYANMMYGENFIKTAQRRKSLVQLASNLGYVPRSRKAAKAVVKLGFTPKNNTTEESILTVPEGVVLSGRNTVNTTYKFHSIDARTLLRPIGSTEEFVGEFDVFQGKYKVFEDKLDSHGGITLPDQGVDYDLIDVFVTAPGSIVEIPFTRANEYNQIKGTDRVYWIEEVEGEKHRIYFGENLIGTSPGKVVSDSGLGEQPVIRVKYFVNNGRDANGIKGLTLSSLPDGAQAFDQNYTCRVIEVIQQSSGGREIESMDSIRHYAPLFYKAQNRAVTYEDYEAIIAREFSIVDDVIAWGGQDNDPPAYGFVYIAIKPREEGFLSDYQQNQIATFLKKNYSIISIDPIITHPVYTYVNVNCTASYDSTSENPGASNLKSMIIKSINNFSNENIERFGKSLRFSKLVGAIDDSSDALTSNNTKIKLEIRPSTIQEVVEAGEINFFNSIAPRTLSSNEFGFGPFNKVKIEDRIDADLCSDISGVEKGEIVMFYYDTFEKLPVLDTDGNQVVVGEINYRTGRVKLLLTESTLSLASFSIEKGFRISGEPSANDVVTGKRNMILIVDPNEVSVTVKDIATGTGTF